VDKLMKKGMAIAKEEDGDRNSIHNGFPLGSLPVTSGDKNRTL
jgi:hypothetical protein